MQAYTGVKPMTSAILVHKHLSLDFHSNASLSFF